jgi:hypothetical protein
VLTGHGDPRFSGDDGSADPAAAAALDAYAAGTGSEHAALTALAGTRLLVPVVAVLTDDAQGAAADHPTDSHPTGSHPPGNERPASGRPLPGAAGAGEKGSEMALPTLIGRDGRAAIPAFTSVETLARWQASARPVPVDAGQVWRAAMEESCAVIIDVAGPVPLAVEGARLAALARGDTVPPPQSDPDVLRAVAAVVARTAADAGWRAEDARFRLGPAGDGDLLIEFRLPEDANPAAQSFLSQVGASLIEALGPRLRRGISVALAPRLAPSR